MSILLIDFLFEICMSSDDIGFQIGVYKNIVQSYKIKYYKLKFNGIIKLNI